MSEDIVIKNKTKKVLEKTKKPKKSVKVVKKSKLDNIDDILAKIKHDVLAVLGHRVKDIEIVTDVDKLHEYIDVAVLNGIIDVDTETNKSLDPLTCMIMGTCLYTPGKKCIYIPVNHVDKDTKVRLPEQINEEQLGKELSRLTENNVKIIMANGGFDLSVIKYTCNVTLDCYWDVLTAARLLDENQRSNSLKDVYIRYIDDNQEPYKIEKLFTIPYELVDYNIFGIYAAWDARMTHDVYEYELAEFSKPGMERLYKLFMEVEMPIVKIVADIENYGVKLDDDVCKKLSDKFDSLIQQQDNKINEDLKPFEPIIAQWRTTKEAQELPKIYASEMEYYSPTITKDYPEEDSKGRYKFGNSKNFQLKESINENSPIQLAIILYDVLKCEVVNKKSPRTTDESALKKISSTTKNKDIKKLCLDILDSRALKKLANTYINKIPTLVNERDERLHTKYNPLGTVTGRFSSSDPNFQNLPSHDVSIRRMFRASEMNDTIEFEDNCVNVKLVSEVLTRNGWIKSVDLVVGDEVDTGDGYSKITSLILNEPYLTLKF